MDSVSWLYGAKDGLSYCGVRKFRIMSTGHESFLSFSDELNILTLLSISDNDIGADYEIFIEAYLESYPEVKLTSSFFVTIEACFVTSLTAVATLDQEYELHVPVQPKTITISAFI